MAGLRASVNGYNIHELDDSFVCKHCSRTHYYIEFGEFEVDSLGREFYLEDVILQKFCKDIRDEKPWITEIALEEQVRGYRKKQHKRKELIMKAHLLAEHKILLNLKTKLAKEFKLEPKVIQDAMEEFDGTTREFYFYIKSIALGRTFDPDKQPRLIQEQPRHILKPKERKYVDLWMDLIKENKWEQFLNWNNYQ